MSAFRIFQLPGSLYTTPTNTKKITESVPTEILIAFVLFLVIQFYSTFLLHARTVGVAEG